MKRRAHAHSGAGNEDAVTAQYTKLIELREGRDEQLGYQEAMQSLEVTEER